MKDERIIVTDINDIYYVEAHEKLTFVYTRREEYVMSMTIGEFCSRLPENQFFRCHRLLRQPEQDSRDRTSV